MKSTYNLDTFWNECKEVGDLITDCWELVGVCDIVEEIYKECVDFNDWNVYTWANVDFPGRYSYRPTEEHFPITTKWIEDNGYKHPELMLLDPGCHIDPHIHDFKEHIPFMYNMSINHPAGCKFGILPDGIIPYEPGDIYKIDVYSDHSVRNDSGEKRYHLVFQE